MCLSFFMTNAVSAQFYAEDFSNQTAAEANWTTGGTNAGTEDWRWTDNPAASSLDGVIAEFGSTTASNGYFLFDSDANGENMPHNITLTGPAIDCSAYSNVTLTFQSQFVYLDDPTVLLEVSTDGTNFTPFQILAGVEAQDFNTGFNLETIDLTAIAAGQSTVYLQFRWVGNWEYVWKIDDINLFAGDSTPPHDLAINGEQFAPNYLQPSSQMDTVRLAMNLNNGGLLEQTNIDITSNITLNGTEVFSSSANLDALIAAGDSIVELPGFWEENGDGIYNINYTVSQDSIALDAFPSDNVSSRQFEINPGLYSKDDNIFVSASQPDGIMDKWEIGNYYYVKNGGYKATEIFFSVASDDNAHIGQSVTVKIYKVTEDDNPSNFTNNDVTLEAIGQYQFTTEASFDIVSVIPENINTGESGLVLDEDSEYLVMISYTEDMFAPYSNIPYFFQVSTVVFDEEWFINGFSPDNTVVVRMAIEPILIDVDEFELSDDNKIEVYPNPVSETLTLDLDLATNAFQTSIRIVDAVGRIAYKNILQNIQKEKIDINVANFPAGSYTLHLATENGTKSKHFVVTR